nr:putative ribonuclease h protein [Quercus suber]
MFSFPPCWAFCGVLCSLFGIWSIWLHWNNVIFINDPPHKPLLAGTLATATEYVVLGINGRLRRSFSSIQVKWLCPPKNWFKLNSDGSSFGNPGHAGGGGIIRNSNGEWVSGYARAIGTTTSVAIELWALRDGLNLCISLNLQAMEIELDAKLVVDLISKEGSQPNSNDVIVADCGEGLKKIPRVRVLYCYRKANKCAHALAHRGALLSQDFVIFSFPPSDVSLIVSLDASGAMYE